MENGGEGGIRTLEGLSPLPVFKTGAFNRSATSPKSVQLCEDVFKTGLSDCQHFNSVCLPHIISS